MIPQSIVFDVGLSLDKDWMWTIYGQSFVLLLHHEETILKAWKNSGQPCLYMDKVWIASFVAQGPLLAHGQLDRF